VRVTTRYFFFRLPTKEHNIFITHAILHAKKLTYNMSVTQSGMSSSILYLNNLKKKYQDHYVLNGITAHFKQGTSYAIVGASGCGKSTLLHLLAGLDTPTSGSVLFNDADLFQLSAKRRIMLRNQSFGFVFQFHYLINELSVLENVAAPGLIQNSDRRALYARAEELLQFLGLLEKKNVHPYELSGGEQQRVAIARALFNKPQFLFADEPTGNLDEQNAQQVVSIFQKCQEEWNMGLILCSHDPMVYNTMNVILHLHNGLLLTKKDMLCTNDQL
jgi:lipoprotein-releasing system ATP-binding protein